MSKDNISDLIEQASAFNEKYGLGRTSTKEYRLMLRKVRVSWPPNNEPWIGYFHQWGVTSMEVDGGALNDTVAIVEKEDGTVIETQPRFIQFL